MEKIFYTDTSSFTSSDNAIKEILRQYFRINKPEISRTENGKPYLSHSSPLFFSVTHTKSKLFIAFSNENVGIDAEESTRPLPHSSVLAKFPVEEREEIQTSTEFLRHWTVKEAAVKWMGGTLAHDFKNLNYHKGKLYYNHLEIPVRIKTMEIEKHILSICSERDFTEVEVISL